MQIMKALMLLPALLLMAGGGMMAEQFHARDAIRKAKSF